MAAGPFIVPAPAKLNIANAADILVATAANFRLALVTSTWAPNDTTDELWAVASANEIANGNGESDARTIYFNIVNKSA